MDMLRTDLFHKSFPPYIHNIFPPDVLRPSRTPYLNSLLAGRFFVLVLFSSFSFFLAKLIYKKLHGSCQLLNFRIVSHRAKKNLLEVNERYVMQAKFFGEFLTSISPFL